MYYQYVAYDKSGTVSKGTLTATSEETAAELLDANGYRLISLKKVSAPFSLSKFLARFSEIKPNEIVLFYRQLALLLGSGIDIITALELLQEQTANHSLIQILNEVIADLRSGSQLSSALQKHPKVFSETACRMLHIGEETGGFENTLSTLADHMEKELTAAKSVKGALVYPVIAAIVTVIVVAVLLVFVLPSFGNLYGSLGAELPPLTKAMITTGEVMKANGLYILIGLAAVVTGLVVYSRTATGREQKDRLILKLPLLGRVTQLKELSRACRNIAVLFKSGLPLTDIIQLTAQSCGNSVISNAFHEVEQDMLRGEGLSSPMTKHSCFLPLMVQMVRVGEETGRLDVNLMAVAQNYETEADDKTKGLIGLIQPAMTLIIGAIVGLVALSLTSAMYSIYGQGI